MKDDIKRLSYFGQMTEMSQRKKPRFNQSFQMVDVFFLLRQLIFNQKARAVTILPWAEAENSDSEYKEH